MEKLAGFDFQSIEIEADGKLQAGASELATFVAAQGVTDVILMCHGFRNDANDAKALYKNFLTNFQKNSGKAGVDQRKFAVGGVFWPSMIFPEPDDSGGGSALSAAGTSKQDKTRLLEMKTVVKTPAQKKAIDDIIKLLPKAASDEAAQLQMVKLLQTVWGSAKGDPETGGVKKLTKAEPAALRVALGSSLNVGKIQTGGGGGSVGIGIAGVTKPKKAAAGEAQGLLGKIFGFVPTALNMTTFLLMFERCGGVGEKGMAAAVRTLRKAAPSVKIHLVGHSLGGRAVTACANSLAKAPLLNVDSLLLLQAAYSHFGLSPGGMIRERGFYRDVIEKKVVKAPIVATYSEKDGVVGVAYAAMASLSVNNSKAAIPGANKLFGGIGQNGVLETPEAIQTDLQAAGKPYTFKTGKMYNLNGTKGAAGGKPLIQSHGDITNEAVTWAFASLVAHT